MSKRKRIAVITTELKGSSNYKKVQLINNQKQEIVTTVKQIFSPTIQVHNLRRA